MFTSGALSMFARYLGEVRLPGERGSPARRISSPVDADLTSFPPVTIHASCDELLLPDAELMAERLESSGIRCDLQFWDKQIHDFPLAADIVPEGRRAIQYIGDFVKTSPLGLTVCGAAGKRRCLLALGLPRQRDSEYHTDPNRGYIRRGRGSTRPIFDGPPFYCSGSSRSGSMRTVSRCSCQSESGASSGMSPSRSSSDGMSTVG